MFSDEFELSLRVIQLHVSSIDGRGVSTCIENCLDMYREDLCIKFSSSRERKEFTYHCHGSVKRFVVTIALYAPKLVIDEGSWRLPTKVASLQGWLVGVQLPRQEWVELMEGVATMHSVDMQQRVCRGEPRRVRDVAQRQRVVRTREVLDIKNVDGGPQSYHGRVGQWQDCHVIFTAHTLTELVWMTTWKDTENMFTLRNMKELRFANRPYPVILMRCRRSALGMARNRGEDGSKSRFRSWRALQIEYQLDLKDSGVSEFAKSHEL